MQMHDLHLGTRPANSSTGAFRWRIREFKGVENVWSLRTATGQAALSLSVAVHQGAHHNQLNPEHRPPFVPPNPPHSLYHRNDNRIAEHLFISGLAYHALHLIRLQLKTRGVRQSLTALQFVLDYRQRITTEMPQSKDRCIQDTDPTPFQRYLASVMGINPNGFAQEITDTRPKKEYCFR
ncbi:MAG: hypothetical protein OXI38_05845 [Bacteroidota bacterium]|nr:hypothetical protein [Bacteroidota bacterium]